MYVGALIELARKRLADTQAPFLWSDEELVVSLNSVLLDLQHECNYYVYPVMSFTTVKGVYSYKCEGKPYTVVIYPTTYPGGIILSEVPSSILLGKLTQQPTYGVPTDYIYSSSEALLYLYPIPDDKFTIKAKLVYFHSLDSAKDISSELDFPDTDLLVLGIMKYAYTKQDSETFDGKALATVSQLYAERLMKYKNDFIKNASFFGSTIAKGLL